MNEEIDVNKIAADLVSQHIDTFYSKGKGLLKGAADNIRLYLNSSYKSYIACVKERYSKAKSFFIRSEPTYLYDFYVPLGVSCGNTQIKKASIQSISAKSNYIVLTGGAGTGKSMLMRHLFLDTLTVSEKIPILIELRDRNNSDTEQSLLDFIQDTLIANQFGLDQQYFEKAVKAGHFAFFFDGFDEVSLSQRKSTSKQIRQLAKIYDKNIFMVSSRPDNEFSSWTAFSIFQIAALSLEQACELVEKLPYDLDLKAKFLKDLRESLFEKNQSFLSNPLLLSIMMLTYGLSADIPNKRSLFYEQAYEALFQRHDAFKGAYQRDRLSDLDIQDFARVFAAFCIQTFDKRIFQFSNSEALEYLEESKELVGLDFNASHYLADALQAVCLLVEDGLLINFTHRSFQEYFVARFIRDAKSDIQQKLIDRYSVNLRLDGVMTLLYEMKPDLVERDFIIPSIERLEKELKIKNKVGITHYKRYLKKIAPEIIIDNNRRFIGYSLSGHSKLLDLAHFALANCGRLVGWTEYSDHYIEKRLVDTYATGGSHIKVSISTHNDELIQNMAEGGHLISKQTLQLALDIKQALIEKHKRADNSLDAILRGGKKYNYMV